MKLKDMKEKHDHKFTDLLKVGIFALLMIAPLFASVSQMLYATFNKNAYQSYNANYVTQKIVSNPNEPIENKEYELQYIQYEGTSNLYSYAYGFKSISLDLQEWFGASYNDITDFGYISYNDGRYHLFAILNNNISDRLYSSYLQFNQLPDITFISNGTTKVIGTPYNSFNLIVNVFTNETLDNAFYYGVDQMTKSDLFNWTQNTAIYTGVKAMTDNLQIQTNAIAILIVYWFILTIIYIIIDIVIKCFTAITHMI